MRHTGSEDVYLFDLDLRDGSEEIQNFYTLDQTHNGTPTIIRKLPADNNRRGIHRELDSFHQVRLSIALAGACVKVVIPRSTALIALQNLSDLHDQEMYALDRFLRIVREILWKLLLPEAKSE